MASTLAAMADQTSVSDSAPAPAAAEYGAHYFENYWGGGGPYEHNEQWMGFFGEVADGIVRDLHPTSVLDAGCALGFLVESLRERGVEAWGIDISEYAISKVDESAAEYCSVASLTEPMERSYDLITCIEVVEHIPPEEAAKVVANLCAATDRILLSSTPGDYGEPTHLNVQPPEAWSAALAREGFLRDVDRDTSYLSPWAGLYVRMTEDTPETVRRYDRAWWRQRREIDEVRASLQQKNDHVSALEDELEAERQKEAEPKDRPETIEELGRREEEILRMRDLVIGKDLELGTLRGQLAAFQDQSQRVTNAAGRLQSKVPGLMRLVGAVLRISRRLRRS